MRRLSELTLSGFRVFRDKQTVPLDANVVLVHGANGSGKSSLLHGIELCLTGHVAELEAYPNSYPDCLQHFSASKNAFCSLKYLDTNEAIKERIVTLHKSLAPKSSGDSMARSDVKHFLDRCYLSQSRLAKLLEVYQAVDKERKESPLATFVRELLGLEVLENITSGLEVTRDIRRVRRDIKAYAEFEKEVSALAMRQESLQTKLNEAIEAANTAARASRQQIGDGDPKVGMVNVSDDELSDQLGQLSADLAKIERAQAVLVGLADPNDSVSAEDLEREIKDRDAIQNDLVVRLRSHAAEFNRFLGRAVGEDTDVDDALQLGDEWDSTLVQCERKVSLLTREIATIEEWQRELAAARKTEAEIEFGWQEISKQVKEKGKPDTHLPEALRLLLEKLNDDICPVCDRDYSELQQGSLVTHIQQKLDVLLEREKLVASVLALQEKREKHLKYISELSKAEEEQLTRLQNTQALLQTGKFLASRHVELSRLRDSWLHNAQMQRSAKSRLLRVIKARQQSELEIERLNEMEEREGTASAAELTSPLDRAERLRQFISNRIKLLEAEREFRAANKKHEETVAGLREQLGQCKSKRDRLGRVQRRITEIVDSSKAVARQASEEKGKVIDRVFSGTLNSLWRDLFQRLVISETFHPILPAPKIARGRLETRLSAGLAGKVSFQDLAAVLSSGNLNTAALSLFLTLNMVEEPKHHVLILDDPVQNMDDVHVVNLGSLLKTIAHQADRQLIVAIHDQSLFDYLAIELGPTKLGESLITIKVERDSDGSSAHLISDQHTWQPDTVRFGSASA